MFEVRENKVDLQIGAVGFLILYEKFLTMSNLQDPEELERLRKENEKLKLEIESLKSEIMNLKNRLMAAPPYTPNSCKPSAPYNPGVY